MQLEQLVARARGEDELPVVLEPGSEHLRAFLGGLSEVVVDQASSPAVRVLAVGANGMLDTISAALQVLGDDDTLVLAMRAEPQNLPVGPLVQLLVDEGVWVLESAPSPARGVGSAFVLTRQEGRPLRSHLLGDEVALSQTSVLRLVAERGVEGLALRAHQVLDRGRLRELQRQLAGLQRDLEAKDASLTQALEQLESLRERHRPPVVVRGAVRAVRRRLRRARRDGGTSTAG